MAQLVALLLAAINGVGSGSTVNTPAQVQLASMGLQQAAQQAPRVPLNQVVPVNTQGVHPAPKTKPVNNPRPKPRAVVNHPQTSNQLNTHSCQTFQATVYGPPWGGIEGSGWTATGIHLLPGRHVIAVDPDVIPLGTRVTVQPNPHHWDGEFIAGDTGGAIQGHIVDIFLWQGPKAMDQWGRRSVRVCRA